MRYKVLTDHPVALTSRDHTHPSGTACDDSRNVNFNRKLYPLFDKQITLVDLGCAGGGFVKSVVDDGHEAIGIEGSDYSLTWDFHDPKTRKPGRRAQWATIPERLFTADVTKPFDVVKVTREYCEECNGPHEDSAEFEVVTCWEMMEHIPEDGLDQLAKNVLSHLAPNGVWIMSVSTQVGFHHVTVKHRGWWLELFAKHGLTNDDGLVRHFNDDWIRGPSQGAPESFHLCLRRN
jgi:SAM-dependent methyltransferase